MNGTGRLAPGISYGAIALVVVIGAFAILGHVELKPTLSPSALAHSADGLMSAASKAYALGTFGEATNALLRYIGFLENHRHELRPYRIVDSSLLVANCRLANLLAHSGDDERASRYIEEAYVCHKALQLNARLRPVPRAEFVDFVFLGLGKLDSQTGLKWRQSMSVSSQTLEKLKAGFTKSSQETQ